MKLIQLWILLLSYFVRLMPATPSTEQLSSIPIAKRKLRVEDVNQIVTLLQERNVEFLQVKILKMVLLMTLRAMLKKMMRILRKRRKVPHLMKMINSLLHLHHYFVLLRNGIILSIQCYQNS